MTVLGDKITPHLEIKMYFKIVLLFIIIKAIHFNENQTIKIGPE